MLKILYSLMFSIAPNGRTYITCMFHKLTGLYCPGCGGSRAVFLLLSGHPIQSFIYHPAVLFCAIGFLINYYLLLRKKTAYKFNYGWLWTLLVIIIVNCIIKNVMLVNGHDILSSHMIELY